MNYSLKFTNELYQLFIAGFNLIILAFDDDFETEDKTKIYHIHFYLYPVYLGIKNNFKDKKSINIKDMVNNLKEFFMSDKFISLGLTMKDIIDINSLFFFSLFIICENIEKYLSIKCLFPLIEELKKAKFESIINKIIQIKKKRKKRK